MTKIILRPSGISGFFDCSYRWYKDTFEPIRKVGWAAHYGTALHKAGEEYYRECIKEKTWVKNRPDYEAVAIDTFRERLKEDEPNDIKEVNSNEVEKSLRMRSSAYIDCAASLNRKKLPIDVERQYTVKVKSNIVDVVQGTLDIVGDDFIADIKTMNRLNSPSKYLIQQGIYAFLREKNDEKVNDLVIHRVLTKKDEIKIDRASILEETYHSMEDIIQSSKLYLTTVIKTCDEFFKTGNDFLFRGNPSSMLCSPKYCAYFDECKYRKLV